MPVTLKVEVEEEMEEVDLRLEEESKQCISDIFNDMSSVCSNESSKMKYPIVTVKVDYDPSGGSSFTGINFDNLFRAEEFPAPDLAIESMYSALV
jgi:hypothetical protein